MPKGPLVTPEAVFEAADTLSARGETPSLRAVRREIGGGSFGTILPMLQSWRRARGEDGGDPGEAEPGLNALPPSVAAALDRLMSATAEVAEAVQSARAAPDGLDIPTPAQTAGLGFAEGEADTGLKSELASLQRMAVEQLTKLRAERDGLANRLEEAEAELGALKEWQHKAAHHIKSLSARVNAAEQVQ